MPVRREPCSTTGPIAIPPMRLTPANMRGTVAIMPSAAASVAPLAGSIVRMAVATIGGWFAIEHLQLGLDGVFVAIAASLAIYGCTIGGALLLRPWQARVAP